MIPEISISMPAARSGRGQAAGGRRQVAAYPPSRLVLLPPREHPRLVPILVSRCVDCPIMTPR
jgi:hypothetical protein